MLIMLSTGTQYDTRDDDSLRRLLAYIPKLRAKYPNELDVIKAQLDSSGSRFTDNEIKLGQRIQKHIAIRDADKHGAVADSAKRTIIKSDSPHMEAPALTASLVSVGLFQNRNRESRALEEAPDPVIPSMGSVRTDDYKSQLYKLAKTHTNISIQFEVLSIEDQTLNLENSRQKGILEYDLKDLLNKIDEHNTLVNAFCETFGEEFDKYCISYSKHVVWHLRQALVFVQQDSIDASQAKQIIYDFYAASIYWDEKYFEDFSCWCGDLAEGMQFTKGVQVHHEDHLDEAFIEMIKNANLAENLFYAIDRSNNPRAHEAKDAFSAARREEKSSPIDVAQLSGRGLITADVGAVSEALGDGDLSTVLSRDDIAASTGWYKQGKVNWSRLSVIRGKLPYRGHERDLTINYQIQPLPGHIGNIKVSGVASYGVGYTGGSKIPNILEVINRLTRSKSEEETERKERMLAELLIRYKQGDTTSLSENSLRKNGFNLDDDLKKRTTQIGQLGRLAVLVCFFEVSRRKNQGYRLGKTSELPEQTVQLPFGTAIGCLLMLIRDGYLSMQEVFDRDAEYGVFTGTAVMSDNVTRTIRKFNKLLSLFLQKYAEVQINETAFEKYASFSTRLGYNCNQDALHFSYTPQMFHSLLKDNDGGGYDSDQEDYDLLPPQVSQRDDTAALEREIDGVELESLNIGPT